MGLLSAALALSSAGACGGVWTSDRRERGAGRIGRRAREAAGDAGGDGSGRRLRDGTPSRPEDAGERGTLAAEQNASEAQDGAGACLQPRTEDDGAPDGARNGPTE